MWYLYIILGVGAGVFSGFLGIGGGSVMIPALVYLAGYSQHQAQGTTLAMMIPPIGLLAAIKYYQAGNVKIKAAVLMCIGFFIGGYLGARFVDKIPDLILKKSFGVFLLIVALRMIFGK
ncbi:MAG: sulfite exporter TauE/SafE family protein [Candidatus Omnitrophica bacterium]|nr:sulfite exporter TauE/SafE family protein [Candidatus Omnitrophota bacterium]